MISIRFLKQECHENYDQEFADIFKQLLRGEPSAALVSASNGEDHMDEYKLYITDHLQRKECPSPCDVLWSVYTCQYSFEDTFHVCLYVKVHVVP